MSDSGTGHVLRSSSYPDVAGGIRNTDKGRYELAGLFAIAGRENRIANARARCYYPCREKTAFNTQCNSNALLVREGRCPT